MFKAPQTEEEWIRINEGFEEKWNFPNYLAALEVKLIQIKGPANSGSYHFNYKGTFIVVLLALVDADCKFTYTYIDCN